MCNGNCTCGREEISQNNDSVTDATPTSKKNLFDSYRLTYNISNNPVIIAIGICITIGVIALTLISIYR